MKYFITILTVLLAVTFVKAQSNAVKAPKIILYASDGKLIAAEKLDSVFKSFGGALDLSKQAYGRDSIVYHFRKPTGSFSEHYFAEKAKQNKALKSMIGKLAEDFSATDMNHKKYTLSELKGDVVVLNFWFTTCPACIEEIPALNNLLVKFNKSKVRFLAITFDDKPAVKAFLNKNKFNLPILPDAKIIAENYSVVLYPTTLVIDKTGKIALAINSEQDIEKKLEEAIDKLL